MDSNSVRICESDSSTTSGTGKLSGLMIGNPKGFTAPSAMQLGEVGNVETPALHEADRQSITHNQLRGGAGGGREVVPAPMSSRWSMPRRWQ